MSESWQSVNVSDVRPGDRVRARGQEFEVARIDSPFLGMTEMVCFIEDTLTRWHAYPARKADTIEIQRASEA
jgi:hypothetical protein